MSGDTIWSERLSELRSAFDQGFSGAGQAEESAGERVLQIRLGDRHYLLRLAEVGGVFVDRPIVRMPSRSPEFLGLAGIRGNMTPVYDLALLLGHPASEPSRWFVTGAERLVGFAFDGLEAHFRISSADVIAQGAATGPERASRPSARESPQSAGDRAGDAARIGDRWVPIVNLGTLSRRVRAATRPLTQDKEK